MNKFAYQSSVDYDPEQLKDLIVQLTKERPGSVARVAAGLPITLGALASPVIGGISGMVGPAGGLRGMLRGTGTAAGGLLGASLGAKLMDSVGQIDAIQDMSPAGRTALALAGVLGTTLGGGYLGYRGTKALSKSDEEEREERREKRASLLGSLAGLAAGYAGGKAIEDQLPTPESQAAALFASIAGSGMVGGLLGKYLAGKAKQQELYNAYTEEQLEELKRHNR